VDHEVDEKSLLATISRISQGCPKLGLVRWTCFVGRSDTLNDYTTAEYTLVMGSWKRLRGFDYLS
ncbi:hypothetical protein FRB98_004992, partial [Tulasnella sp. 332]